MKPKYTTTYVSEPETGEDCETRRETHESLEEEDDRREEPVKRIVLLGAEIIIGRGEKQPQSEDDAKVKALNGDEDEPPFASPNIITPTKPIRKSARVSAVSKNLNMTATRNLVVYGPVDEAKFKALNAFIKEKTLMSCQYKQALPGHASPTFSDRFFFLCQLVNTMEFPRNMFSDETRPAPTSEIQYGSIFKALKAVKIVVGVNVWEHVENSPLGPARSSIFEFEDIT
ncbi:hypothetical protein Bca101_067579 [Brassica carinata]